MGKFVALSLLTLHCVQVFCSGRIEVETDITGSETQTPRGLVVHVENRYDYPVNVYYDNNGPGVFMVTPFVISYATLIVYVEMELASKSQGNLNTFVGHKFFVKKHPKDSSLLKTVRLLSFLNINLLLLINCLSVCNNEWDGKYYPWTRATRGAYLV